jgi:hypothetical protein
MSTTELDQGASAGAAPVEQEQTAQPEQQDAGDAHQQTDSGESSDQSIATETQAESLTPEQRTIKKLEARIARLAGKRGAAEREVELLRHEVSTLRSSAGGQQGHEGDESGDRPLTKAEIERLATKRADEIATQRSIGEKVRKVIDEGQKIEGFGAAIDALAEVVPFKDAEGRPSPFIKAVLKAPTAASLLKYLGDNPDEAEDLAALDPVEQGWRFAELSQKLTSAKKQTSAAPAPIKPVSGATTVAKDEARMTDAEWRAQRFKRN